MSKPRKRHYYTCRECGYRMSWPLDICEDCGKDFDGDGTQLATEGNSQCVHCGSCEYDRCCPECRAPVNEEKWERIEDRILKEESDAQAE